MLRRSFWRLSSASSRPTQSASRTARALVPDVPPTQVPQGSGTPSQPRPKAGTTVPAQPDAKATKDFQFKPPVSWDKVCQSVAYVHQQAEAATSAARMGDIPEILRPESELSYPRKHVSKVFTALRISRHLRFELAAEARDARANGAIIASEETSNTYTFLVSNVATPAELSSTIASIPDGLRRLHAVFGIDGAPCDFFCDCDWKRDMVADPEPLLHLVIETTLQQLSRFGIKEVKVAIFHSPASTQKHSFHIHFQSPSACLADYTHARSLAYRINEACQALAAESTGNRMKEPLLDTAIYRNCGQMRMAHQAKASSPSNFLVLYTPKDKTLAAICTDADGLSIPQQIEMTFCVRRVTEGLKLAKVTSHSSDRESDGRKIRYELRDAKKANRFEEVRKAVLNMPPEFAREYRTWNNIGCALFSFGPEFWDRALDTWLQFSRMAGDKFDPTSCTRRWHGSYRGGSRGTALLLNWRRGYTYIMFTIWGRRLPPIVAAAAVAAKKKASFMKKGKK